jgi:lysophospholipase L1-like esterase
MKTNQSNRRDFISKMAIGTLGAISMPHLASAAFAESKAKKIWLNNNDVILFQGDSITDAGRSRTDFQPNSSKTLGQGYAFHTAAELLRSHPTKNLQIHNRGISGHKVPQLAERWDKDTIELKPTVLSILIGVNDYWHLKTGNYKGTAALYKSGYRELLQKTKEKLPDIKLIILEPFAIIGSAVKQDWFEPFQEYQNASKEMADEFDAPFVPYQKIFNKALETAPGSHWAPDGVHPSIAGARLMADAWLNIIKD